MQGVPKPGVIGPRVQTMYRSMLLGVTFPLLAPEMETSAGGGSAAVAVRPEVYGIRIDEGLDPERIKGLTDSLVSLAEKARRFQKAIDGKRNTVADEMLGIARSCQGRDEWNQAYDILKARYSNAHGPKAKLPAVMVQYASDIRKFFDAKIDLNAKSAAGEPYTYSAIKKAANEIRLGNAKKAKAADLAAMPEWLKEYRLRMTMLDGVMKDPRSDKYPERNAVIEDVNRAIADILAEHREEVERIARERRAIENGEEDGDDVGEGKPGDVPAVELGEDESEPGRGYASQA